ncbi:hypothetical protein JOD20_002112 [Herpetosiphon giganteus]|nr:hypothetical protein [Herpetosiphon giganteus]
MLYCLVADHGEATFTDQSSVRVGIIAQTIALLVSFLPAIASVQQRSWCSRYLLAWSPNDEHSSCLGKR